MKHDISRLLCLLRAIKLFMRVRVEPSYQNVVLAGASVTSYRYSNMILRPTRAFTWLGVSPCP